MNRYTVFANAKINVGLNVYDKDESGYHKLDTIMLPIDLKDELDILILEKTGSLNISCSEDNIPTDERNILYKTYKKFFEKIEKDEIEINVFLKYIIAMAIGVTFTYLVSRYLLIKIPCFGNTKKKLIQ